MNAPDQRSFAVRPAHRYPEWLIRLARREIFEQMVLPPDYPPVDETLLQFKVRHYPISARFDSSVIAPYLPGLA
jgi:hypothetical protein